MDLTFPDPVTQFRSRVRAFLAEHLPADWRGLGALSVEAGEGFRVGWRKCLVENGLLAPHWPIDCGGLGLGLLEQAVMIEEFLRAGVPSLPHPNDPYGINLLGPTLLAAGNDEQRSRFLPGTVDGSIRWAQGFSEPDAGSDLFALRTRGRVEGDELIIDGQKTWQSAGLSANWMFTLVRTDPNDSKHRGLSFVMLQLDQPGVDVRGIRTMTGELEFSEVFLDGARATLANVVGGLGGGAATALTLLGLERGAGGLASALALKVELERLIQLINERGAGSDASIKRRAASCFVRVQAIHDLALRVLVDAAAGVSIGAESSLIKMLVAEYHQDATELALDVLGPEIAAPFGAPAVEWNRPQPLGLAADSSAAWVADFFNARAATIYGGSSQIQRNTIAERILGLPREARSLAPTKTVGAS